MTELVHSAAFEGRTITATWYEAPFRPLSPRVYGVCSVDDRIALVRIGDDSGLYIPGGGVELGETFEEALARELREEIAAEIDTSVYIGCQRVDDFEHPTDPHSDFHLYYACRVTLGEFVSDGVVTERVLVAPEDFVASLAWSDDPTAPILLERSLELISR
jgi:8-oxo-dGTP pyrophosphatase MutT (NUDIX family)